MRALVFILTLALPGFALANDRLVRLHAPPALVESGLLKHILPRFSLKNQVRVEIVDDASNADFAFGQAGEALFSGLGETWHMDVLSPEHLGTQRLVGWLNSDIGRKALFGFAPDGTPLFELPKPKKTQVAKIEISGDAVSGKRVSLEKCGRCHVTERGKGFSGIGSTPSFFVLRGLSEWENRFTAFYTLKPHPAFTQVADVTEPFPPDRPSPIAPIELTLDDLDAILSYVTALDAADLGKPLEHQ